MPNQDNTNQNSNQGVSPNIPFSPQADLPPLPPEFQNLTVPTVEKSSPKPDSGSATPPVPEFSNITANPKKKFGTGKIIATILGVLALVGSIGAGTYLVGQRQLFQQKASSDLCSNTCATEGAKSCVTINGKNNGTQCTCTNIGDFWCCNGTSCNSTAPGATRYKNVWQCATNTTDCPTPPPNQTSPPQQPKTGWGIGKACKNNPSTTGDHCIIIRCPNGCVDGCSENAPGATFQSGSCDTLAGQVTSICGQVDLVNASGVYCESDGTFTDAQINCPQPKCAITSNPTNPPTNPPSNPPTTPPTPTSSPVAPYCAAIHVYDTDWNLISQSADTTNLSTLKPGDTIRFTVEGSPAAGIDMAKFTITAMVGEVNQGTVSGDVTDKKPDTNEFYYEYTIPSGATSISVSGQVHSVSGWF